MSAREDGQAGHSYSIFEKPDVPYDDSLYDCFKESYEELHWYEKAIMDKYFYQGWSIQRLHEYYGISKTHIVKDINNGLNSIRQKCKHC